MKDLFLLRPDIIFLNHGSYGACPRPVFEVYQGWQRELEAQPVEFLSRRVAGLLAEARQELATYLHTLPDNLVFVPNATTAINTVARGLALQPGDEVLATNHEYGAIDRTWRFICSKSGASYRHTPVPVPLTSPEDIVESIWQAVRPRTRVISISHLTSATALIFPVAEVCRRAREAGILTVVDGAHTPGQMPLHLEKVGADFYAGNCHKWLCAPKGSAFLYARPEAQPLIEPLVVSWGYESLRPGPSRFIDWLEWQGTRDIAAYLSVPAAIRFQAEHNWEAVQQSCHQLLKEAMGRVNQLTGLPSIYPEGREWNWYRQMAIMQLPPCDPVATQARLWEEHRLEVPVLSFEGRSVVRLSVQAYNNRAELDYFSQALQKTVGF